MAAGHPDAAVRPIVELVGQRMTGIVELQGGIPEELYIVVAFLAGSEGQQGRYGHDDKHQMAENQKFTHSFKVSGIRRT